MLAGEESVMAGNRDRDQTEDQNSRWPNYVQYLFVVFLTLLFLSLAVSMKKHHFLSGSQNVSGSQSEQRPAESR